MATSSRTSARGQKSSSSGYRNLAPRRRGPRSTVVEKYVLAENPRRRTTSACRAEYRRPTGKSEIAVARSGIPATRDSGAVFYIIPPADRTSLTPVTRKHEPRCTA